MRVFASLQPIRILATPAIIRRAVFVAALALVERLLAPATAWALFAQSLATKACLVFVLGATFTFRSFVQRAFVSRAEAELVERVIRSLLDGDSLRASVLPDTDARSELGQGVYFASQQLGTELPVTVADLVASATLTVLVVSTEPGRLVAFVVGLTLVAAVALAWSRSRVQSAISQAWTCQTRIFAQLVNALEGRLELAANGLRSSFLQETRERAQAWKSAAGRVAAATVLAGRLPLLAIATLVAVVVGTNSHLFGALGATLSDAALFASVTPAFAGVAQGLHAVMRTERWGRLVASVIEGGRLRAAGGRLPPEPPGSIAFDGACFRYDSNPNGPDAVRDMTFDWDGEQILALVGANGSGKSTFLHMMLALAPPRTGSIRIGGVDLRDVDLDAWRGRIAFLPQRPYLPQRADVRTGVRLLAPDASDQRIQASLSRVGLWSVLDRGKASPLEVQIDTLSTGQRQRVALARFLCRDSSLLVLDEPDANLDREGISLVAELLQELAHNRSVVFAAHTPELVAIADRVITLDAGRIVRDETRSPAGRPRSAAAAQGP